MLGVRHHPCQAHAGGGRKQGRRDAVDEGYRKIPRQLGKVESLDVGQGCEDMPDFVERVLCI